MAQFYKGFVLEWNVSAPLTIEGNPVRYKKCRPEGSGFTAWLPNGETINAASKHALVRCYIKQSGDLDSRKLLTKKHVNELRKGKAAWNRWRRENPQIVPMLADEDLSVKFEHQTLAGYDFSYTNFCQARMQGLNLRRANFHQAILARADLSGAQLDGANFCRTDLYETNLQNASLTRANLQGVQMVRTKLRGAHLQGCKVYGLSAWDLRLDQACVKQQLTVSYRPAYPSRPKRDDEPEEVQVESLDLAAFMYLTLNNRNISRIIEAAGRKWVLLLGRFSKRKGELTAIAKVLKKYQYTPIIFDFPPPNRRDLIETVMLLAGLSAAVIVEITSPRSTPMELQAIAVNYGVPIYPFIQQGAKEFATLPSLRKFPWVHGTIPYNSTKDLITKVREEVIRPLNEEEANRLDERERKGVPGGVTAAQR